MPKVDLPVLQKPLVPAPETDKVLSTQQRLFRRLCEEIEQAKSTLEVEPARLSHLFQVFLKELNPVQTEIGTAYLQMAEIIQQKTESLKTSKSQRIASAAQIQTLLTEAESYGIDTAAHVLRTLYPPESDQKASENPDREPAVPSMDGIKTIGLDGFAPWDRQPKARISKKERQKKVFEESKHKLQKSMYLALAKLLHPDLESDPERAAEKQELMKLVTQAYQAGDLSALLRMELAFVHKESAHLDRLTENRLAIYNNVLQEQVTRLKERLTDMRENPAFQPIGAILNIPTEQAEKRIRQAARVSKEHLFHLRLEIRALSEAVSMAEVLAVGGALMPGK